MCVSVCVCVCVKNSGIDEEIIENDDKEEKKEKVKFDEGMMTRAKKKLIDGNNEDVVATYWMTIEQKENFEDYAVYTVEIPTKEQNTPECDEAKYKEIENLVKFDVFEEVDDVGQE